MKKLIAASLSLAMLFGLTACGGSKDDDTPIEKPSAVATQAKTEATTSDVIQYDPLEDVEITINPNTAYPGMICIWSNYDGDNYEEFNCIIGKILSANSKEIVIELSVDEEKFAKSFGDTPYVLKNTKKELTFSTKDIYSAPLYSDYVTENVITGLGELFKSDFGNIKDELSVEAIYVTTLEKDEMFLTDHIFLEDGIDEGNMIIVNEGNASYPYQLWFVYKNQEGKIYLFNTWELRINNGEYNFTGRSKETYDTIEAAKQSIEDFIADYDNVKLEELEIPSALKD